MIDLLPCPFCACSNVIYTFCGSQGYIECNECGTQGPCDERAADPICDFGAACDAWNRRAVLAQPEPQGVGPTDEELLGIEDLEAAWNAQADAFNSWDELGIDEIVCWTQRQALARWGRPAKPEMQGPTEAQLKTFACEWWHSFGFAKDKATCTWVIDHVAPEHFADFSRDVLARWGRPAVEPVPVSERLPGPEDCTTNPRTGQGQWCWGWVQHDDPPYSGRWRMMRREWLASEAMAWLPHHALPVPQQEAGQ